MPESPVGHMGTERDVVLPRVGAFVVDHVVSFVVAILGGLVVALFLGEAGIYLGVVLGYVAYFVGLEGLYGRTVGKRIAGIVVVSSDGSRITMRQAAIRNLLRLVDGVLSYAVGLVVMLITDRNQRVGDLAARTVVVRARR